MPERGTEELKGGTFDMVPVRDSRVQYTASVVGTMKDERSA